MAVVSHCYHTFNTSGVGWPVDELWPEDFDQVHVPYAIMCGLLLCCWPLLVFKPAGATFGEIFIDFELHGVVDKEARPLL